MSLKKVEQVKKDRFFRVWDILVYGLVAEVIAALFIAWFVTRDTSALTAVNGYYGGNQVFSYDFVADELIIISPENVREVPSESADELTLIFITDGGDFDGPHDYNTIVFDKSARTVRVTESDCSGTWVQDCVVTGTVSDNSKPIICLPHRLEIYPAGYNDADDGEHLPVG